jgi:hypothetical protein
LVLVKQFECVAVVSNRSSTPHLQVQRFSLIVPKDNVCLFIEENLKAMVRDSVAYRLNWTGSMGKVKIGDFHIFVMMRHTVVTHFPEYEKSFEQNLRSIVTKYLRKVQDRYRKLMLRKNVERIEISVLNSDDEFIAVEKD